VRSGPIIQAALNISCENMISEMCPAENILQRLGRLNRFAEFENATLKIALTDNIDGGNLKGVAILLSKNFQWQSTKKWIKFLQNKTEDTKQITITDLYAWYQEFYKSDNLKEIEQDFIDSLKNSVGVIENNIFEPKRINLSKNSEIMLKKHSLRGNSRFVNMVICDIKNRSEINIRNEYLDTQITLNVNEIEGYQGTQSNLLVFMKAKHHYLVGGSSLTRKTNGTIKNNARNPEKQIYVSYEPQILQEKGVQAETDAIYYIKGIKQAIGIMAISKLQNDKK
jgi:CRISPR-associated endonuclease/helicase Cas3